MTDTLTPEARSKRMSLIRGKNTGPELLVRRLLHAQGFRYRLHSKGLPGKPDIVFPSLRKAIFVHGCFWHGHTDPTCRLARVPKSRIEFWTTKVRATAERDKLAEQMLSALGWESTTVWECELRDQSEVLGRLESYLRA